jgi:hypothetical protein
MSAWPAAQESDAAAQKLASLLQYLQRHELPQRGDVLW